MNTPNEDFIQRNGREDRTIRISSPSFVLDVPMNVLQYLWTSTKEVVSSMALLWIQPIMDSKSLVDFSIGLLLLEIFPRMLVNQAVRMSSPSSGSGDPLPNIEASSPSGLLFATPFLAVLGSLALVLSCLSNQQEETRFFPPTWVRMLLPRPRRGGGLSSSSFFMYLLLLLFCLESMLMISILIFGFHAMIFLAWAEEDVKILTGLMAAWLFSLTASSFVRYYLYYIIGD